MINKFLRQLEDWQIITLGIVATLFSMALWLFPVAGMLQLLLSPLGVWGYAAMIPLALAWGWFVAGGVATAFIEAYYDRKLDAAMVRINAIYEESKRSDG